MYALTVLGSCNQYTRTGEPWGPYGLDHCIGGPGELEILVGDPACIMC